MVIEDVIYMNLNYILGTLCCFNYLSNRVVSKAVE